MNDSFDKKIGEKINELNKIYGRKLTVEELSQNNTLINTIISFGERENLDKYVLIHLTDYIPINNEIKTPFSTKLKKSLNTRFGNFDFKSFRNTVHFAVNSFVTSHNGGDWTNKKYAVIVPMNSFAEKNGDIIKSCSIVDFFVRGSAQLPDDSFMLVPFEEVETIQSLNPNVYVIGYNGKIVSLALEPFFWPILRILRKEINEHGVIDDGTSLKFQRLFQSDLEDKLGRRVSDLPHRNSIDALLELKLRSLDFDCKILDFIKKNNLINQNNWEDELFQHWRSHFVEEYPYDLNNYSNKNFEEKEDIVKYIDSVNAASIPLGVSDLQLIKRRNGDLHECDIYDCDILTIRKRIKESAKIDLFIGKDITQLYDTDMLITNINRIIMIISKIDKENLYNDKNAYDILNLALSHLQEDYNLTIESLDLRKVSDPSFDFEKYKKLLDIKLKPLHINSQFLNQKKLTKTILKNAKAHKFIENNIPNHGENNDLVLETIMNLNDLSKFIINRSRFVTIDDFLSCDDKLIYEALTSFYSLYDILCFVFDDEYLLKLKKSDIDLKKYLFALIINLKNWV